MCYIKPQSTYSWWSTLKWKLRPSVAFQPRSIIAFQEQYISFLKSVWSIHTSTMTNVYICIMIHDMPAYAHAIMCTFFILVVYTILLIFVVIINTCTTEALQIKRKECKLCTLITGNFEAVDFGELPVEFGELPSWIWRASQLNLVSFVRGAHE